MAGRGLWLWSITVAGCAPSSLGYGTDKQDVSDTGGVGVASQEDTGSAQGGSTTTQGSGSSTSGSTTSPSTSTSTSTSTTGSTSSGTGTGTGGPTKLVPGPAGTYRGTIRIDYELVVPLVGGSERCTGEMELVWDPDVSNDLSGDLLSCDWPLLSIWANLTMGDVEGRFDGVVLDGIVSGNTTGGDGNFWSWDDAWSAFFHGDTIIGGFDGRNVLVDNYTATFELTYTGS